MRELLKRHFLLLNFLLEIGLFMCTLFGFIALSSSVQETNKPAKIFGIQTIPLQVREEAKNDLQKNLHGAKLNKTNREALNFQLAEVGLYLDDDSKVQLMSDEEFEKQRKQRYEALLFNMKIMLHNGQVEYSRGMKSDGYGLLSSVQNIKSSTLPSVEEEEEEEEVLLQRSDYKQRVNLRQKLLMRYILISLDEGLRKDNKYKGKRVVGSQYIQEQLKKYSK